MLTRYIGPARQGSAALLTALQAAGVVREGAVEAVYFFFDHVGNRRVGQRFRRAAKSGKRRSSRQQLARLAVDVVIDGLRA